MKTDNTKPAKKKTADAKKTGKSKAPKKQTAKTQTVDEKPMKLSKAGEWMRDHPNGILKILDWDAVNATISGDQTLNPKSAKKKSTTVKPKKPSNGVGMVVRENDTVGYDVSVDRMSAKPKKAKTKTADDEPKKLSKIGEWMRDNPNGILRIIDMEAVLR